jgi:hypothetical protein
MAAFGTPDRLAGLAGVAPVPHDSRAGGRHLHRPGATTRGLQRVFYTSALISIRCYQGPGTSTTANAPRANATPQAVLALARRRVNVLWALLRDGRCYELAPSRLTRHAA